ncbi:TetR/AcrR family transcriptional regulator [Conexibacter arvalis]|uniref:AcrR family transcriptional regulator n=1 Tax=Conexibacter arvalis TaxID=912552 RepID=A0A840IJZ1_9ACTN|nr:TetR/AcrR family transcriptional regulator [Conexibacter arvalis]MBB4664248.1 AcrR family transcriptional regulator [Conexibacter arvalis]
MSTGELGLRERKKARTRRAIVRAALELTLEQGFAAATIPQIAERADVAPRTVSLYFPHKEEIVFDAADAPIERLADRLSDGDGDLVDRLSDWIADQAARIDEDDEIERLRHRAIATDPDLRMRDRLLMEAAEERIAAAVAAELGSRPDAVGPRVFATATLGILATLRSAFVAAGPDDGRAAAELTRGLAFLRGGLAALRESG